MSVPASAGIPVLAGRNLSKGFFGNPVLKGVSIALLPGSVHALLGENGAGKSTLINLLSGALAPDSGEILVDGRPMPHLTPAAARAAGIAVVQQELSLAPELSIAENIGMGAYPRRFGLIDYRALARRAHEACRMVGLDEPLSTPAGDLALGRRQMVEIAKALFRRPRVLILDEPTSSLSAHEAGILAKLVFRLKGEGVAILFISHRLNEVMALCDGVTVLKDGVRTAAQPLAGVSPDALVRLMVGREAGDLFPPRRPPPAGAVAIELEGFSSGTASGIDLVARRGEVIGIGGLVGQGQEDFLLGLAGAEPARAKRAVLCDRPGPFASVGAAAEAGVAYVPADRKREGLVLTHSIASNLILPSLGRLNRMGLRDRRAEASLVRDLAARLTIKGDVTRPVQALSGGNQQKVALAKWLPRDPAVLLLNDPTRGVDIDTKREIYLMLQSFAEAGKTVLLLSSDALELVHLSDRVMVFREGKAVAMLPRERLSEEAIVAAAMGVDARGEAA